MVLRKIEQRLERLVEGAASAFGGAIEPIEIGRKLLREMDRHLMSGMSGRIAPNDFMVELSARDFEQLEPLTDALAAELHDAIRTHAKDNDYHLMGNPRVAFQASPGLGKGKVKIHGRATGPRPGEALVSLRLPDETLIKVSGTITIGRLSENDVELADPSVSRHHVRIEPRGAKVWAIDLGSTNGTRLNGVPISESELNAGDILTVGVVVVEIWEP